MGRLSSGAGAPDPEPEPKPPWTFGKRSDSDEGDGTTEGPGSESTAAPPGCWSKPDIGLAGSRTGSDPGGAWRWADVGEAGAASLAAMCPGGSGCAERGGLSAGSGPVGGLDCGFGTRITFVGAGTEAWVSSEGSVVGVWVGFGGTRTGTRVGFESGVWRPADPEIRAKVLSTSGDSAEVWRPDTLTGSEVLVRLRVWAAGPSGTSAAGEEAPDADVVLGAGVVSGSLAWPSVLIIWMEGGSVLATPGLESELQ